MAREGEPIQYPDFDGGFVEVWEKQQEWLRENYGDRLIKFQVADGYAVYYVDDDYVLHHDESGDAYRIPDAHIRGLRRQDIDENLRRQRALNEIFGGSNA